VAAVLITERNGREKVDTEAEGRIVVDMVLEVSEASGEGRVCCEGVQIHTDIQLPHLLPAPVQVDLPTAGLPLLLTETQLHLVHHGLLLSVLPGSAGEIHEQTCKYQVAGFARQILF